MKYLPLHLGNLTEGLSSIMMEDASRVDLDMEEEKSIFLLH